MNSAGFDSVHPIHFAGATLGATRHICGLFRSPEEEYRALLPFIKEGLDLGEKAFHVVEPGRREGHLDRMRAAGIDTADAERRGQLELCNWDEVYFPDGRFDQNRRLATWQDVLDGAERDGFALTRLVAHMEWSLEDREGVSDLLEYEARFNLVHRGERDPVVCAYDLARYSGEVLIDILRTHPMVIMGGILQENPFFVPPAVFLRELRERRGPQNG